MRSRYSGTSLQLHPAPLGLLTFSDIMCAAGEMPMKFLHLHVPLLHVRQCFNEKKSDTSKACFFFRAALYNAEKPHAAAYGFAQPVYLS
jgi:hypothetical protein